MQWPGSALYHRKKTGRDILFSLSRLENHHTYPIRRQRIALYFQGQSDYSEIASHSLELLLNTKYEATWSIIWQTRVKRATHCLLVTGSLYFLFSYTKQKWSCFLRRVFSSWWAKIYSKLPSFQAAAHNCGLGAFWQGSSRSSLSNHSLKHSKSNQIAPLFGAVGAIPEVMEDRA